MIVTIGICHDIADQESRVCGRLRLAVLGARRRFAPARSSGRLPLDDLDVLQVQPNFYVIAGAGGEHRRADRPRRRRRRRPGSAAADQVLAEIKKLTDSRSATSSTPAPIADHVGGNEKLSRAGESIIADRRH